MSGKEKKKIMDTVVGIVILIFSIIEIVVVDMQLFRQTLPAIVSEMRTEQKPYT
jgi:hypothetical protein